MGNFQKIDNVFAKFPVFQFFFLRAGKLTSLNARTPPKTSDTSLILKIGSGDVIVLVSSLTWAAFIRFSPTKGVAKMNRPNFSVSLICVCYFYPAGRYRKGRNAINTYLSTKFTL
ncbi:hypothetical protein THS27_00860 [Thalassospira sp. MCCC 1A01428]|nr:hypothetical protein THS27_00860 [Thalassospira sp. MCCC 1A01428]